jgi:hypothetical protein
MLFSLLFLLHLRLVLDGRHRQEGYRRPPSVAVGLLSPPLLHPPAGTDASALTLFVILLPALAPSPLRRPASSGSPTEVR